MQFVLVEHMNLNIFNIEGTFSRLLSYKKFFGGVTSFRPDHFELINGFSNKFYGWGGEDNDLFHRWMIEHTLPVSLLL